MWLIIVLNQNVLLLFFLLVLYILEFGISGIYEYFTKTIAVSISEANYIEIYNKLNNSMFTSKARSKAIINVYDLIIK